MTAYYLVAILDWYSRKVLDLTGTLKHYGIRVSRDGKVRFFIPTFQQLFMRVAFFAVVFKG